MDENLSKDGQANPVVPPREQILDNANTQQNKSFKIIVITIFIALVVLGGYFLIKYLIPNAKQKSSSSSPTKVESSPTLTENKRDSFLVYNIEGKSTNNIIVSKDTVSYNLETKEKVPFKIDSFKENNLPTEIKSAVFLTSTKEDDVFSLSDTDNFIIVSKYNQKSKQTAELVRMPKSQVLGTTDWRDFSFSPDRTKLIYATFGMGTPANVYLIDLSTKQSRQITNNNGDTSPKWLDNDRIIFQRRDKSGDSIWTVGISSEKEELLLGAKDGIDSNTVFRYVFTQDGNKIIFPSNLNKQGQDISLFDISSKQITKLFHIPYQDFTSAQITKNGRYLVWGSLVSGEYGSRSIFSYDLIKNEQNTICKSLPDAMCGDFYIEE